MMFKAKGSIARFFGLLGLLLCLGAAFGQTPARADSFSDHDELNDYLSRTRLRNDQIMFILRNNHPNTVDVEFYSEGTRRAWPGNGQVYSIKDSAWHTYVLNCVPGEKICFGAGVRNQYRTYWGVGINKKHSCSDCCYTCGGVTSRRVNLNP